jgi:AcrR family transcriptional regulator
MTTTRKLEAQAAALSKGVRNAKGKAQPVKRAPRGQTVKSAKAQLNALQPNGPKPRGERFVAEVLRVTLTRLAEVGYERLSIPDVAALAAVNKTSVYRRWPSKIALVGDALALAMAHVDHVPDTGTLRGDLVALASAMGAFTQSSIGTAMFRIVLAQDAHPELRTLANAAQQAAGNKGPWVVVKRAIKRGELSPRVDISLLLYTIAGAMLHRVFVEKADVRSSYVEKLIDLVLLGVTRKN